MNDLNLSTLSPIYSELFTPIAWEKYLWILVGILSALAVGILFGVLKKKRATKSSIALQLHALDFQAEPTESLYAFSLLMQSLPPAKQPDTLSGLLRDLERYKYTPNPPLIPPALMQRIETMIHETAR